jgi:hypothetical protein
MAQPGIDEVGLPTGEEGGEAFDFGGMFDKVKNWVVNNDDKIIRVIVPWLKKRLQEGAGATATDALELPNSTPITAMVRPSQIDRLSPAVKKLTKEDLLALGGWGMPRKLPRDLGLTTKDIQTIREVFTQHLISVSPLDDEPDAWSLSCCSCTPCCCAAAVTHPVRAVA